MFIKKMFSYEFIRNIIIIIMIIGITPINEMYAQKINYQSITSQDLLRINEALKSWGLEIDKNMNEGKFRTMVLIKLGTLALDDLYSITKNTIRLEKLKPIRNLLSLVDDFFDPEGNAFISYEESNNLLNILYNNLRS